MFNDTIYGLATCYGKSAIAIFRITGRFALDVTKKLNIKKILTPRLATLCKLFDDKTLIDEAIIIFFPKNSSVTGEDLVEIHLHGSIAVIKKLTSFLNKIDYIRLAEPGEFTRKSLENNKISLVKAEGLLELINSETEFQRNVSIAHYSGDLESLYKNIKKEIINILSKAEAYIDFPDDMLNESEINFLDNDIKILLRKIENLINDFNLANIISNGVKLTIVGKPNTGKSTLINLLTNSDTSIVSEIPGTTRDIVKEHIEILGIPITLSDTAGIRSSNDKIEKAGMTKAKNLIKISNILALVLDITSDINEDEINDIIKFKNKNCFVVIILNKIDLCKNLEKEKETLSQKLKKFNAHYDNLITTSLLDKKSKHIIENTLHNYLSNLVSSESTDLIVNLRQQKMLKNFADHLKSSLNQSIEIKAEELRAACLEIGALLGNIDNEEILDDLFGNFCIGK